MLAYFNQWPQNVQIHFAKLSEASFEQLGQTAVEAESASNWCQPFCEYYHKKTILYPVIQRKTK